MEHCIMFYTHYHYTTRYVCTAYCTNCAWCFLVPWTVSVFCKTHQNQTDISTSFLHYALKGLHALALQEWFSTALLHQCRIFSKSYIKHFAFMSDLNAGYYECMGTKVQRIIVVIFDPQFERLTLLPQSVVESVLIVYTVSHTWSFHTSQLFMC